MQQMQIVIIIYIGSLLKTLSTSSSDTFDAAMRRIIVRILLCAVISVANSIPAQPTPTTKGSVALSQSSNPTTEISTSAANLIGLNATTPASDKQTEKSATSKLPIKDRNGSQSVTQNQHTTAKSHDNCCGGRMKYPVSKTGTFEHLIRKVINDGNVMVFNGICGPEGCAVKGDVVNDKRIRSH